MRNKLPTYRIGRWISYKACGRSTGHKGGWIWYTAVGQIVHVRSTNVDVIGPGISDYHRKVMKDRIIEIFGDGPTERGPAA